MEKKHCLNLEDMSKNMFDCLKSFYKIVEQKGGEKVSIEQEQAPKCVCKITKKMCVATSTKPSYLNFPENQEVTGTFGLVEYDENKAKRCPYYSELEE